MGPRNPDADVGEVFGPRRRRANVDDAMAAHERFATVDDDELAMVAVVQHADVADSRLMEEHNLASGFFHLSLARFADFLRADCVQHHTHLHACAGPLGQRVRHALAEHAFLPQESFEVHRVSADRSRPAALEKSAVLEHLDRIAGDRRAERQTGERRDELVDRGIALDVQLGIAMASDRPDDDR